MKCDSINYCIGFDRICGGDYDKQRAGIYKQNLINIKTFEKSSIPVVVVRDGKKYRPIALNFCPICGTSFEWIFKGDK